MKKMNNKQAKRASKAAKAENLKKKELAQRFINVKNAEGDADTVAEIVVQNQIDYTPKVSVIIPVYNVEPYLRECLDSVVNQTLQEIEIICVDDGSTDKSLDILLEYAKKDKRITVLKQENLHAGVARNAGLAVAKGEYLSFLDSDDFFELNMLEAMYKKAKEEKADITLCNADKFNNLTKETLPLDAVRKSVLQKKIFNLEELEVDAFFATQPATWNKLYNKKFILNTNIKFQKLISCNDFGFSLSVLALAKTITALEDIFIHYRKFTNTAISKNRNQTAYNIVLAYLFVKNNLYKNKKEHLLPALDKRFIAAIKYESSLCSAAEKINFREKTKELLQTDFAKFNQYFPADVIPLVVAGDNNYAMPLAVCLYSILEKTKSFLDIYVLSDGITNENIAKIKKSIKKFTNYTISFVNMKNFNLAQFPKIDRFEVSAFARYFIPEICAKYDKVIYTDADVVFNGDVADYFSLDLEDKGIAAVPEELGKIRLGKYNHEYRKKLFGITPNHQYFANGNLLISCNYWRKHNITAKLIAKTNELKDNLVCPDLDVMNVVFQNNYKKLHFKYCVTVHRYTVTDGCQEMLEGYSSPFIIHYSGDKKPWNTNDVLFFDEFNKIYKKTAFASNTFVTGIKNGLSYLCFPFDTITTNYMRKKRKYLYEMVVQKILNTSHLDIKSSDGSDNFLQINSVTTETPQPKPYVSFNDAMTTITSSAESYAVSLKIVHDCNIVLSFHGGKKYFNTEKTPLWIDYKSIKINNEDVLEFPVATWQDKTFDYEISAKAGQIVTVEVEQQPHLYTAEELNSTITAILSDYTYSDEDYAYVADKIRNSPKNLIKLQCQTLKTYPQLKASCFIPIGTKCRVAQQLRYNNLRVCSLPFDWLAGFSLTFVIKTIKNGISSWFSNYYESSERGTAKNRCIYDLQNKFRSRHIFPTKQTLEEYFPEFMETFSRRYERFIQILEQSSHVCFVCNNRHKPINDFPISNIISKNQEDTVADFVYFLQKLSTLYPHKKWSLIHVEHSDTEREIKQYTYGENITVYNIKAYDIYVDDGSKKVHSWVGNLQTWRNICRQLSIEPEESVVPNKETV